MAASLEHLLLAASVLLLLSVIGSKISARLGVPALLLFLVIGMLAGSEGLGGIYFDDAQIAQSLGVVALVLILFAGGLETRWTAVRSVLREGLLLSTLGVFTTAGLVAVFTHLALGFSLVEGMLLGAIVASTDAAAVFTVLNTRTTGLKVKLSSLLELESGSNDPMAIFLTISMLQLILNPALTFVDLALLFAQQMAVGAAIGYACGYLMIFMINRLFLEYDGLYPVLTISLVFFTYGSASLLGGNPFVAVYLAAILLGNRDFIHKNSLIEFHDGLAWLMQIVMFLTLGLLVFPSQLRDVAVTGVLVSAFLIVVARPTSVLLSLAGSSFSLREKLLVSWVGLRGAAPIILATFPLLAGISGAHVIFNLVFFVVLTSVLIQGTTIRRVAKLLDVERVIEPSPAPGPELSVPASAPHQLLEVVVPAGGIIDGKRVLDLGLPEGSLIVLVTRGNEAIVPRGSTVIAEGDRLLILADRDEWTLIEDTLQELA